MKYINYVLLQNRMFLQHIGVFSAAYSQLLAENDVNLFGVTVCG